MKHRDLVNRIKESGGSFVRNGSDHDMYKGPNGKKEPVPRHREIDEITANEILKKLGVK